MELEEARAIAARAAEISKEAVPAGEFPKRYGEAPNENEEDLYVAGYVLADDWGRECAERAGFRADEFDWRRLGWSTMTYACWGTTAREPLPEKVIREGIERGHIEEEDADRYRERRAAKKPCGWEHRVWLSLGCEGPKTEDGEVRWIPVPFVGGTCPRCTTGLLSHVRFREDEVFSPREIPASAPRFVVPPPDEWERLAEKYYGGANYEDPTGRTR